MTELEKHPFYFNIELIEKEIDFWLFKNNLQKAINVLEDVEYKWFSARNEKRVPSGLMYKHLEHYAIESIFMGLPNQKPNEPQEKTRDFLAWWIHNKIQELNASLKTGPGEESQPSELSNSEELNKQKIETLLTPIWKEKPTYTVEQVLKKGFDLGLWDENYVVKTKRKGLYGSGKNLISNLYHVLLTKSIKENLDYKEVGKVLCQFFGISIKTETKEPYKSFQQGNPKAINELKKRFP